MNTILIVIIFLLFLITIITQFILFSSLKKDKVIPWTRTPLRIMKMLFRQKPVFLNSWNNDIEYYTVFPHDRKILIVVPNNTIIQPNSVICVGTNQEYDKYLIAGPINPWANTDKGNSYILDVDYLGQGSNNKDVKVTYTL